MILCYCASVVVTVMVNNKARLVLKIFLIFHNHKGQHCINFPVLASVVGELPLDMRGISKWVELARVVGVIFCST